MSTQLAGDLLHQWMSDHKPDWKPRAAPHANAMFSEDILGNKDAKAEWKADDKPVYLFTHTASYKQFKEPGSLFLFGRRGTGKTALIRMLDHQIKEGQDHTYRVAWVADTHNLLLGLSGALAGTALEQLDVPKLTNTIEPIWRWIVHMSAMFALLEESENSSAEPPELKLLRRYLNGVLPEDWPR